MNTATALRPRRVPAPATEPPFDGPEPRLAVSALQGTLALQFRDGPPRPGLHLVPEVEPDPDLSGLPSAYQWAESVARGIAEILAGSRPASQFRQWCTPEVFATIGRRGALAAAATGCATRRAAPGVIHVCCPARAVAEVSTVVHGLARPKALAFRIEARSTRWVCTALELG